MRNNKMRVTSGAVAVLVLSCMAAGCSYKKDAEAAAQQANTSAARAETAASRAEAAAARVEDAARRAEAASQRTEAIFMKHMRK